MDSVLSSLDSSSSWYEDLFNWVLYNIIYSIFYYLEAALCIVLSWLDNLFRVFTGQEMVKFGDGENYLINVFFQNNSVRGVYLGMASIGIVFAFISALVSVIRKTFDADDKVKMSMGQILTNLLRSILIIVSLNAAILVVVTGTNVLMDSLDEVFDNADDRAMGNPTIEFTNEQFAAMARIFNTIGNYSMNPSYKNRANLNCCYNDIRGDIGFLAETNMFKYNYKDSGKTQETGIYYESTDKAGNIINTWQSVIQEIANAADYNVEQPVDVYNEGIANAISDAMTVLKTDSSFQALEKYTRTYEFDDNDVGFDKVVFLMGTMGLANTAAAKNDQFNKNPQLNDAVRGPYYRGLKNIYDLDQVNADFDISLFKTNYLVAYFAALVLGFNMLLILLSAVARIYNMLFLYVIAPPIIGIMPLDDGGKFRQWLTAFIVQTFSIFATIISMRLFLIFVPIVLSPTLEVADNPVINMIGKFILLYAGFEVIGKANGILTGILADQAGMQSIQAGDMGASLKQLGAGAAKVGGFALSGVARLGGAAASSAVKTGKAMYNAAGKAVNGKSNEPSLPEKSGVAGEKGEAGGTAGGADKSSDSGGRGAAGLPDKSAASGDQGAAGLPDRSSGVEDRGAADSADKSGDTNAAPSAAGGINGETGSGAASGNDKGAVPDSDRSSFGESEGGKASGSGASGSGASGSGASGGSASGSSGSSTRTPPPKRDVGDSSGAQSKADANYKALFGVDRPGSAGQGSSGQGAVGQNAKAKGDGGSASSSQSVPQSARAGIEDSPSEASPASGNSSTTPPQNRDVGDSSGAQSKADANYKALFGVDRPGSAGQSSSGQGAVSQNAGVQGDGGSASSSQSVPQSVHSGIEDSPSEASPASGNSSTEAFGSSTGENNQDSSMDIDIGDIGDSRSINSVDDID